MRGDSKAARIKRVRTVLSAFHKLSEEEAKKLLFFQVELAVKPQY